MSPASEAAPRTGQLPIESTGFVGRQSELATLGTLLSRSRLVTVTGPGGVGKTRLALHYATRAAGRYPQGAVFAELSGLGDPGLLALSVASAAGLNQQDARDPLEMLANYLRDRELLLILDTCEHLLDACAMLTEALLREAPKVTILVTSRQPLDAPGESTFPLRPFQVPDESGPADGDAVELFTQRAAAALAGFRLTADNTAQVIRLCQQLEGIPLAIELAAVRLRAFDPAELTRRLDRRLHLLAGGRHATAPRHRALRDTIGWSYDLCTPEEQVLWARLSVFAGPFTVRAAEDVCGGGAVPRDTVLNTLIGLVDKSVLIRDDTTVPCYRMLDTIREYGAEQLDRAGTADRVRTRMLRHYRQLAENLDADPLTGQLEQYRTLRAQHDNIRAAFGYGLSLPGQEEPVVGMATCLYWYILISGEFTEARHWLSRFLERFGDPSPPRAAGLLMMGLLMTAQGADGDGLARCAEGLSLAGETGDRRLQARGHLYYCLAQMIAGYPEQGLDTARLADKLLRAAGDVPNAEALRLYVAVGHMLTGDFDQCLADCAEALRIMPTEDGERWVTSFLLALSGATLFFKGDLDRALSAADKSLEMRRELGDTMGMAFCLNLLGVMAADQSRFGRAAWLIGAAGRAWASLGTRTFIGAESLTGFAQSAIVQTRKAMGEDAYERAVRAAARQPLEEAAAQVASGADGPPEPAGPAEPGSAARLTAREREIAALVAEGRSNRDIAGRLFISRRTVDSHVEHIFGKLGVSSRVQLALWVRQQAAR